MADRLLVGPEMQYEAGAVLASADRLVAEAQAAVSVSLSKPMHSYMCVHCILLW